MQRPIDYLTESGPFARVLIAGLGLIIIGVLWLSAGYLTENGSDQISLFSALLSGMLSIVVAWIYLKIAEDTTQQTDLQEQVIDIQSQQTTIMEQQQRLMEFQYIPRVRLREFELLPENKIRLTLTNVGNGLAEKMFLRTSIFARTNSDELPTYDLEDEIFTLNDRDFILRPGYSQLMRNEEKIVASDLYGETLKPNESEVVFKSRAQLGAKPVNEQGDHHGTIPLPVILEKIRNKGFSDVHIELSIVYSDINGTHHIEYVVGRTVGLETGEKELAEMINTDFVTHWSPKSDEERIERIDNLDIYPPK